MLGRLRCLLGRHEWQPFHNREVGDAGSPYLVCARCGKDKPHYDPPSEGQAMGLGGAGGV
jgi:hypothetical protein